MSEDNTQTNESGEAQALRSAGEFAPLAKPSPAPGITAPDPKKPAENAFARDIKAAVDFAAKTNAYVTDYIKFGDAKSGAILSFATLVAGAVASSAPGSLRLLRAFSPLALAVGALAVLGVLAFSLAVAMACIQALAPRTPKASSLHSFPDIATMKPGDYESRLRAIDHGGVTREYANHTQTLSAVAVQKFDSIARATRLLRWMLVCGALYAAAVGAISVLSDEKPKTVTVVPGASKS